VTQVKRFSLAMLLIASALVATAAPAFAQVGVPSDPDQRWLLGMVIVALTLIIAFLMAWYLPMGSKGDGPRRWVSRFSRKTRRRHRRKKYNP
jgi:Na+/melibiose symporter-like transporter